MIENEKKYGSGKTKSRDYCPDDKFKLFSENISICSVEFANYNNWDSQKEIRSIDRDWRSCLMIARKERSRMIEVTCLILNMHIIYSKWILRVQVLYLIYSRERLNPKFRPIICSNDFHIFYVNSYLGFGTVIFQCLFLNNTW